MEQNSYLKSLSRLACRYPQDLATGPCSEPDESSPHPPSPGSLNIRFSMQYINHAVTVNTTLINIWTCFIYVHNMFRPEGPSSGDLQILKLKHWIVSQYGTIL
jgi:hypothetical protein